MRKIKIRKIRKTALCLTCRFKFILIVPESLSPDHRFRIWHKWNRMVDVHASNCGNQPMEFVDNLVRLHAELI